MGKNILSKKNSFTGNKILDGIFFILSGIIVGKLFRKFVFRTSSPSSASPSEPPEEPEESEVRPEETEDEGNNEEVYEEMENEISTIDRISNA